MQKFLTSLVFAIFSFSFSFGQTPTPKTTEDDDVVKISTTLIQIDVTVTDQKGKIVTNLKSEDFEIFENDKKQEITNFTFVSPSSETKTAPTPKLNKDQVAAPIPAVELKPEQVKRTIAIVVDDLGLSFESVYRVQKTLKKFVDEQMQPNDLVAIIRTKGGIGALQQFTSNKNQLYAAIDKIRFSFQNRVEDRPTSPMGRDPMGKLKREDEFASVNDDLDDENSVFRRDIFMVGTLTALYYVAKGMSELPGKKAIMFIADGLPFCNPRVPDDCVKKEKAFRELTEFCNRSAVTIHTQDARGLETTGINAADMVENIVKAQETIQARSRYLIESKEGLSYLAEKTGGRVYLNNNDLSAGLETLLEETRSYYLIGYQPDSDTFDPKTRKFNKFTVKVKGNNLRVRYRSGFFGVADSDVRAPSPAVLTTAQQIHRAIASPFAENGITLRLNTLFGKDDKTGSFVRSFVHIEGQDLKFVDEKDGSKKTTFNILAVTYGENGILIDQMANTYTMTVNQDTYQKIVKEGFVYNFVFPIKKPGAYQMRVAIRDTNSLLVGSAHQFIVVPELKKGQHTLSGILLENLTESQWNKLQGGTVSKTKELGTDPMQDTSLRRFKKGTALRYALEIYNAKLDQTNKPNLNTQIRMFRDGKIVFEGEPTPLNLEGQTNFNHINYMGALVLGGAMQIGDYILQIIVIDNLGKNKRKLATQWVQFEIIE